MKIVGWTKRWAGSTCTESKGFNWRVARLFQRRGIRAALNLIETCVFYVIFQQKWSDSEVSVNEMSRKRGGKVCSGLDYTQTDVTRCEIRIKLKNFMVNTNEKPRVRKLKKRNIYLLSCGNKVNLDTRTV